MASEAAPAAMAGRPDRRASRLVALVTAVHREAETALAEVVEAIRRVNEDVGAVRAAVRRSMAEEDERG